MSTLFNTCVRRPP